MITAEQINLRKNGIGGSDAAALCGVSPYSTPRDLWFEKTADEQTSLDNIHLRIGNHFEPFIIKEYEKATGYTVSTPSNTFVHKDHPFLIAHVDGLVNETGHILEAKTCLSWYNAKKFGEEGTDQIPDEYLMQCVHYAAVLDKPAVEIAALVLGQLKLYRYERNDALEQKYINKATLFWEMVQTRSIPSASTYQEVMADFKDTEETTCSDEAIAFAQSLKDEKEKLRTHEQNCLFLKERLALSMGKAATLLDKDGKKLAKIVEKKTSRLDKNKLIADVPDLSPYYTETTFKEIRTY